MRLDHVTNKDNQQQVSFDLYYFEFGRYAACRQHLSHLTSVLHLRLPFPPHTFVTSIGRVVVYSAG